MRLSRRLARLSRKWRSLRRDSSSDWVGISASVLCEEDEEASLEGGSGVDVEKSLFMF